jgi:hypothetical protein
MDVFAFRALERLAAVIIGGMAIYLGYRLFLAIQTGGEGKAEVSLPGDVTIMISRVGPGVFFALFGTIIVAASFYYAISYSETAQATPQGTTTVRQLSGIGPSAGTAAPERTAVANAAARDEEAVVAERLRLRQEIEFLNRAPDLLRPGLNDGQREEIARHLREIKLRLMQSVWGDDWGDPRAFRDWAENGPEPADGKGFREARGFYDAGEARAP